MHNRIAIIIISVILVLATIGGVVVMLIPKNTEPPVDTEPPKDTESTITGDSTTFLFLFFIFFYFYFFIFFIF